MEAELDDSRTSRLEVVEYAKIKHIGGRRRCRRRRALWRFRFSDLWKLQVTYVYS